jgi:hypothetical protein
VSVFSPTFVDSSGRVVMRRAGVTVTGEAEDEQRRIDRIRINRAYYDGTQYDLDNQAWCQANNVPADTHMPEHMRLHAYSTQIAECVEFIANQLTSGFQIVAEDQERVQKVIDDAIQATDLLRNESDEDLAVDSLMIEGGQAGDVPYETLWDPVEQTVYWEYWPAEQVEFKVPSGTWVKEVIRTQTITVDAVGQGGAEVSKQVLEKVVYDMAFQPTDLNTIGEIAEPRKECRRRVYWDAEAEPRETSWLGLPFIPWGVLRVYKEGIRGFRGDPLITRKAIDNADRLNAVEQHAFKIARYNSHGNVVVVGDQGFLQIESQPQLNKDVADVIKFPGGTGVFALTLPTDPQMIQHTRAVTADAIYASFGLTRVEPDTLDGLGGITGYALEILNRKSEGKLKRVRRTFKTDWVLAINQALDVYAYRSGAVLTDPDMLLAMENDPEMELPTAFLPTVPFWQIDPEQVFPNRSVEIRMGSGYIVDDVQIRDDYTAKLISRKEALRQRGLSDDDIDDIETEITDAAQAAFEGAQFPTVAPAGQTVPEATRNITRAQPIVVPSGTQAGQAVGSTARQ